jgi:HAE1 family hydrophobic/amphiphilic exporter-1
MSLAKISIQRPLMMIMIILAVSMFGVVAWLGLPVDRMPDMDLPYITVQAIYPGAGPAEVETNVVKPIEEQVSTVAGIKNVTSYCLENMAYILLQFNDDIDANMAAIDVKDKIDQILFTLPEDLEKPVVAKWDPNDMPIVTLAVTGDMSPVKLRSFVDQQVKDRFGTINGVAKVEVTGGREREILVSLDAEKMAAHNLSIFQVSPLLQMQNAVVPAGYVTGELREYSVKMDGEFTSVEEIAGLAIPVFKQYGEHQKSYQIKLSDIATISDSYKQVREEARYQGQESVQIGITKSGDANTAATAGGIIEMVEKLKNDLPSGIEINIVENKATFIQNAVDDTYGNILMGIFLTAIILFMFLFDWRITIIAAVTMPVSLIMAAIGMSAMGFSLNMVSMMGLTIAVGILVTNAIVVIENIVRHRNNGETPAKAAQLGADEIFMSILASTLTNLAVFIPIASTTGMIGSIFKSLGMTIVFATVASLFLSFTLVPLMASKMLKEKKVDLGSHDEGHLIDRLLVKLDRSYAKVLDGLLGNRLMQISVIGITIITLVFTMKVIAPQLGSGFAPAMDQGFIDINIELPAGTPIDVTRAQIADIEERMKDTPHLLAMSSSIGGSGTSSGPQYGRVILKLTHESEREQSIFDIIPTLRPKLADFPDAKLSVAEFDDMAAGAADIVLEMAGPNLDTLIKYNEQVKEVIASLGGLTDINSSWKGEKPEILVTPNRERMEHYGLSPNLQASASVQMVGGLLRYNITGDDQAIYREDGEEYPIRVQLNDEFRKNIRDIETMQVMTPRGPVPLEAIASVEYSGGVSQINRKNRQVMLEFTANITEGDMGSMVTNLNIALEEEFNLPLGYSFTFTGDYEMMQENNAQMGMAMLLAVALVLMVLIALLESIPMGLVIFATLPMGLIGVIWGLYLTGNDMTMISNLSVIMLIGVVVNNAILLIDYARHQRQHYNVSPREAIVQAAEMKLKPIIMSNLAIIVSMVPMALALGSGGSFRAPFAITAIAGVAISTVLTFFGIPILYIWTAPKHVPVDIAGEERGEINDV